MHVHQQADEPGVYSARTTDVDPRRRVDYWTAAFGAVWGEVEFLESGERPFYGDLCSVKISSLRVNRISFEGMAFLRSSAQSRKLRVPFYSLAFPVSGHSMVSIASAPVELQAGEVFLLDNSRPAQLVATDSYETLNVQIPLSLIQERLSANRHNPVIRIPSKTSIAGLLRPFVQNLYEVGAGLDDRSASFLERQICDLVTFCFTSPAASESEEGVLLLAHRKRADRCIERLYSREDLSPKAIAAACGISESYLHRIYRETGKTAMERVREVRMDMADELLRRGLPAFRTVSEIAYEVGFKSLSEFSRAYKRRFGRTPRQARG
jgi:AraC-like DNA-binding protein